MMGRPNDIEIRRWQREVASDPGSLSLLPLADVYRREGRLDVARRLCIQALMRHPEQVEGHFLLGRVYREEGNMEKARDEWEIALTLDARHRAARRALGYVCLESRDWPSATKHLELALAAQPGDSRLASAYRLASRRTATDGDRSPTGAPSAEVASASALEAPLARFARETGVRVALVIDGSGRILAHHGFVGDLDVAGFASLGAGIHSASRAMAGMLQQSGFTQLYQGRGEHQLFVAPIDGPTGEIILMAAFGADSTIGLVRIRFGDFYAAVVDMPLDHGGARPGAAAYTFEAALEAGLCL
jgi:hypothetical protein